MPSSCANLVGTPTRKYHFLFLGRAIPGRPPLADSEWTDFAARVVTAQLPDGLTELDAEGPWQNPATHRTSRESTKVIIVAVPDSPATAAAIAAVEDAYGTQFHQQSVGTTLAPVCAQSDAPLRRQFITDGGFDLDRLLDGRACHHPLIVRR